MQVVHRDDRSSATYLLHNLFIRPLATRLRKAKTVDTPDSPRLNPPFSVRHKCKIHERQLEGIWIYDIIHKPVLKTNPDRKTKHIYYFAGGSWQAPPDDAHFKFLASIATRLAQPSVISLISCPLAPESPAKSTVPQLIKLYNVLTEDPTFSDEEVCFAGDSSGGNLALALITNCLSCQDPPAKYAPASLVLICPTVDLVHAPNPELEAAGKRDPLESLAFVRQTADTWAAGLDKTDPMLSPNMDTIKALAERQVKVYGIIAGHDVLGVEAKLFVEQCKEAGVRGRFLIWERQMHNFPLTGAYKVSEGVKAMDWIAHAVENGGSSSGPDTDETFALIEGTGNHGFKTHRLKSVS